MSTELKEQIARAIRAARRVGDENDVAEAVLAVLREQEPAGLFTRSDDGGLVQAHDGMPLYAAPVPPAESAARDQSAIEAIAHRTCTKYLHGERPEYTFLPHTLMDFVQRLALPAPAASAVLDRWRNGVEAVAQMIQKKADDYAQRFGRDDMGGLSFGQGSHAHAKLEYHSDLCELAEEVRAMLAAAPKPEGK